MSCSRRHFNQSLLYSGLALAAARLNTAQASPLAVEIKQQWPDGSNTGAPSDVALERHDGNLVLDKSGTTVSNLDIRGTVTIKAPNVTLKNSRVTSPSFYTINITGPGDGVTIQDCTIDGTGTGNEGSIAINGPGTFLRNNIFNVENGFAAGSDTLIQDNYVHDLLASGAPHYDGIQIDGGQHNVVIRHNTIINSHNQTSAVMIDNWAGAVSNVVVDNNILVGGGYTIYVDAQFNSSPITGVVITNNRMGSGGFGIVNFNRTRPVYTGNTNDGATLARGLKRTRE